MKRLISQAAIDKALELTASIEGIIALTEQMLAVQKRRRWQILEVIRANATGDAPTLAILKDHLARGVVPGHHIYPTDFTTLKIYRELTKEKAK